MEFVLVVVLIAWTKGFTNPMLYQKREGHCYVSFVFGA